MRLTAGGIREMHWHLFAEWAYMTYGTCRITILDQLGRPYIADVKEGDLWYFPAGLPHSLQGLGPDGCEFLICFDEGKASEFSTLLVIGMVYPHAAGYSRRELRGSGRDVREHSTARSLHLPGQSARRSGGGSGGCEWKGRSAAPVHLLAGIDGPDARNTKGGTVHIADSKNFTVSTTVAAALLTIRPGGMREMHWHPNADEWQYWIKGKGTMTIFNTGPNAVTMDFNAGDIGYVKKNLGHYIKNTGDTDLQVLEVFRAPQFQDVSLSDWITHTPPALVAHRLVGVPCIAAFWRVKSLLRHHSDRPKFANRSAGYFAGATSLTGVFSASVFSPCLFAAFRSRAMRPARRSCTTRVSSAFF